MPRKRLSRKVASEIRGVLNGLAERYPFKKAGEPLYPRDYHRGVTPFALIMENGDVAPLRRERAGTVANGPLDALLTSDGKRDYLVGAEYGGRCYWVGDKEKLMDETLAAVSSDAPQVRIFGSVAKPNNSAEGKGTRMNAVTDAEKGLNSTEGNE